LYFSGMTYNYGKKEEMKAYIDSNIKYFDLVVSNLDLYLRGLLYMAIVNEYNDNGEIRSHVVVWDDVSKYSFIYTLVIKVRIIIYLVYI